MFSDWFANLKLVWINIWHRSTEKPGKKIILVCSWDNTGSQMIGLGVRGGRGWEGGEHSAEFYSDVILPYIYM